MDANSQHNANRVTWILLLIYMLVLCWILLFKLGVRFSYMDMRSASLVPYRQLFMQGMRTDKAELILNIIIFVPLGVYTGILFHQWTWTRRCLFFLLLSTLFELIQYVFKIGAFDSTDIVNNVLGAIIGVLLLTFIEKLFKNQYRAQIVINILAIIGTATMVTLLVMLKLNMLPIRYQ